MANKRVGIFARVYANGIQKTIKTKWLGNARLESVPGGVFWLTWREGAKQKYLRVNGDVNDVVAAQLRQERVLGGEVLPAIPSNSNRRTLADAMAAFLDEKAVNSLDLRSRARWKWDLEQFAKICAKTYLDEIDRRDIFKWMAHFTLRHQSGKGGNQDLAGKLDESVFRTNTFVPKSQDGLVHSLTVKTSNYGHRISHRMAYTAPARIDLSP
jgi:hypothetical protein